MKRIPLVLIAAALLLPAVAQAWGQDGHRIVCEIAWQELAPEVRVKMRNLLPSSGRYQRFTEACLWADHVRGKSQFPQYADDDASHFVNIGDDDEAIDRPTRCSDDERCVIDAIELYSRVLAGEPLQGRTRRQALMFLAHFVGDVHQPLHAGYGSDRGGNFVPIRYFGQDARCDEKGRRCEFQLHRLWDSLLPGELAGRTADGDWERLALGLQGRVTAQQREKWLQSAPIDWGNESVTVIVNDIYPIEHFAYVGESYYQRHDEAVAERLQQAGVRLAGMLADALGD